VKETVAYCDLDDKDARRPGVAVLKIEVDGVTHVVDVCQVHLTLLTRLPTGATRGRRRAAKRTARRVPAKRVGRPAAAAAPAKAAKKAAPARKRVAAKAAKAAKAPAKKAPAKKATKRVAKATRASAAAGRVSGSRRDQQQRIAAARDWARAQGRAIADKGRLPAGLLEEFARSAR
jgi:hypothetical protein